MHCSGHGPAVVINSVLGASVVVVGASAVVVRASVVVVGASVVVVGAAEDCVMR